MENVRVIDCDYIYPEFAAAYLLWEKDEAAFIETNTAHSVPKLLKELQKTGLRPEQVRYVVITHAHLDHAGGTSALMQACPNATLLAHPRAAPHMIDPAKLVSSARKVYGSENFQKLYGEISPISADRVQMMEDGAHVVLGAQRQLRFIHTRGHANHHYCIYDSKSNGVFTGDSFGLGYPIFQEKGLFIFPSTSPTDFEPVEAKKSIQKIQATGANQAYLTHFGAVSEVAQAAAQLIEHLEFSEHLFQKVMSGGSPEKRDEWTQTCRSELVRYYDQHLRKTGFILTPEQLQVLDLDLNLNAAGIVHSALRALEKGKQLN